MIKTLFLLLTLLVSGCNDSRPTFNKLSQQAVILAFGDSLTYGTGASPESDYPTILSKLSGHEVINVGVPGEISSTGLKRLPALLEEYQPELLILIHGGNDFLRKIPKQQTKENLEQMIDEAKQRDIKVVLLGVPSSTLFLLSSAEIYQEIAEQQNTVIDLDTMPKILSSKELKSDTIHPNDQGYRLMAENIFNLLVDSGALTEP